MAANARTLSSALRVSRPKGQSRSTRESQDHIHFDVPMHFVQESRTCRTSPVHRIQSSRSVSWRVPSRTTDNMITHGKLSCLMISMASDVLPEPLDPAIPMILISAHGGE